MDELEPWNMFTNDFVTDEADELAADDNVGSSSSSKYRDEVKVEPMEAQEAAFEMRAKNTNNSRDYGKNTAEEGDDTIFDFGLEPQAHMAGTSAATLAAPESQGGGGGGGGSSVYAVTDDSSSAHSFSDAVKYEDAVVYICPACGAEFTAQDAWKRHMNCMHNFNTRRGLNFVQIDKLYHQCLECHKRIAMHSMENLLKHKFTHLPYRCTKCMVCLRQYKYRQDLMVHLRMIHREDLLAIAKAEYKTRNKTDTKDGNVAAGLTIGDIKENAIDIFENTFDNIEVKNELIEPDDHDELDPLTKKSSLSEEQVTLPAFLEDALSRGSSPGSGEHLASGGGGGGGGGGNDEESCEQYILYICPQCGTECETQPQWRQHIEFVHDFGTRRGLNFKEVNMNQHAQCMECNQIVYVNVIRNLQFHKFTHLPHKLWLRCKLCFSSFAGHKEIVKHLSLKHRLVSEWSADLEDSQDERSVSGFGMGGDDDDDGGAADTKRLLCEQESGMAKGEERDTFEQHIDYICPQCGKEFFDKKLWRKHIVEIHQLADMSMLNFEQINDRQLKCRECDKVITNAYGIQNAQQHRITHMPYKAFARCRLCIKSYTDRKGLVKHLRTSHRIGEHVPIVTRRPPASRSPSSVGMSAMRTMPPLQPKPYRKAAYPQKEIVRHANYTFEIQYLDEEDSKMSEVLDSRPAAELGLKSSLDHITQNKCVDCGSIFGTQHALQTHIKAEHEFLDDTKTYKKRTRKHANNNDGTNGVKSVATDGQLNEKNTIEDNLLVPAADSNGKFSSAQGATAVVEHNFCYLCPDCGVESKTQLEWRRHINEEHNFDKRDFLDFRRIDKYRYQCTICKDIVSNPKLKGLQDHKFRHLPYRLYIKCLICGTCYNHKPNMMTHLRQRHNIVERSDRSWDLNESLGAGKSSPRPVKLLSSVSSSFAAATGKTSTETTPPANAVSNRPPGLKTVEDYISFHNAVDHDTITYHCPQCNENFDTHVFWRKHIVEEHNLNSREGLNFRQLDEHHYLCLQCYKRVTVTHTKGAIGQLQSHKFRHLPYKSFRCTTCQGEFVRKQMFFKHLDKVTNRCSESTAMNSSTSPRATKHHRDRYEDSFDTNSTLSQHNGRRGVDNSNTAATTVTGTNEALIVNQASFTLSCPQCGIEFESQRDWREHINTEHNLGNRCTLNFKKLTPTLHQCLECKEHVNGRKLRDLQIHKFKHLPHGAYLHCRFCQMAYYHIGNIQDHLKHKHPNVVQKHEEYEKMAELQQYEEESVLLDGDDDDCSDEADQKDTVITEDIEEVEAHATDLDEQYLLG